MNSFLCFLQDIYGNRNQTVRNQLFKSTIILTRPELEV